MVFALYIVYYNTTDCQCWVGLSVQTWDEKVWYTNAMPTTREKTIQLNHSVTGRTCCPETTGCSVILKLQTEKEKVKNLQKDLWHES